MIDDGTPRDRAWLVIIDALRNGHNVRIEDVAERADVSKGTAQAVVHVARDDDLLVRNAENGHWWQCDIGPLADTDDDSYKRAIQTLLEESPN